MGWFTNIIHVALSSAPPRVHERKQPGYHRICSSKSCAVLVSLGPRPPENDEPLRDRAFALIYRGDRHKRPPAAGQVVKLLLELPWVESFLDNFVFPYARDCPWRLTTAH